VKSEEEVGMGKEEWVMGGRGGIVFEKTKAKQFQAGDEDWGVKVRE
jgi:hypothetical protein